jgi:hypothetical protein
VVCKNEANLLSRSWEGEQQVGQAQVAATGHRREGEPAGQACARAQRQTRQRCVTAQYLAVDVTATELVEQFSDPKGSEHFYN